MKISVLASGSKGNCTYLEYKDTKILIDVGVPLPYLKNKLKEIGIDIKDITAIVVTHTHSDHICGLSSFCKKYDTNVYITELMKEDIGRLISNHIIMDQLEHIIDDITLRIIPTSHDTSSSIGFIIKTEDREIVYITDTGYINKKHFKQLINKDMYILESNHDIEMLMNGRYPYHLKQRILSDIGHLSNHDSAMYLSEFIGNKTKCVVLAHLSEENNNEEIALNTLLETLSKSNKKVDQIYVARQRERTDLIEI